MILNEWINKKLAEIASKLPTLAHQDAASFSCGYNTGYKRAMLDLEKVLDKIMDDIGEYPRDIRELYKSTFDNQEIF